MISTVTVEILLYKQTAELIVKTTLMGPSDAKLTYIHIKSQNRISIGNKQAVVNCIDDYIAQTQDPGSLIEWIAGF